MEFQLCLFGEIRTVHEVVETRYQAFDYDGNLVVDLTGAQALRLSDDHPFRIKVVPLNGQHHQNAAFREGTAAGLMAALAGTTVPPGLTWLPSCRLATTDSIPLGSRRSYRTIDGVVTGLGDRILVRDQLNDADNGIYIVAIKGVYRDTWTRAPDAIAPGATTRILEGDTHANCIFVNDGHNWLELAGAGTP